ncbi:hypothetical protein [Streptomyces sp. NPDC046727]|uniref:hypothetical protein n=1 Tax=Streptomyces sp. NPDC046727 TaxID=3155373 RepID=UPI0033DC3880
MRTFLAAVGACLATALGAAGTPAAGGFLVSVVNNTNRTAYVYPNAGCFGPYEGWVLPGGQATMNGAYVSIDQRPITANGPQQKGTCG